jgi:hypothetical protein
MVVCTWCVALLIPILPILLIGVLGLQQTNATSPWEWWLSGTWNVMTKVRYSPAISLWSGVAKQMRCTGTFENTHCQELPTQSNLACLEPLRLKKRDWTHNKERGHDMSSYGERSRSREKGETFSNGFWNIDLNATWRVVSSGIVLV